MKKNIHPKIYTDCVVTCVCGNKFTTISTQPALMVDICSNCHPFFTGQQKFVDTEGRIEKFNKKAKVMEVEIAKRKIIKAAKKNKKQTTEAVHKPSLKELMEQMKEPQTTEENQTKKELKSEE